MNKPLYPIKADPTTLDGVKLTLGVRGSVEEGGMTLSEANLIYLDGPSKNTVDELKIKLENATDTNLLVANSLKVSNSTDTIHIECKKDGLVVLDTTGQSNLTVDKLVLTSGVTDTLTLDESQLLSNTSLFKVKSEFAEGTISLEAPKIELSGAITIPVNAINAPAATPTGDVAAQCIRVKVGESFYRIMLHNDV